MGLPYPQNALNSISTLKVEPHLVFKRCIGAREDLCDTLLSLGWHIKRWMGVVD